MGMLTVCPDMIGPCLSPTVHITSQLSQLTVLLASAIASAPGKKKTLSLLYKSIMFLQTRLWVSVRFRAPAEITKFKPQISADEVQDGEQDHYNGCFGEIIE